MGAERFDRHGRLRGRAEIQAAFDHGRKQANRQLVAWILERAEGPSRLGLSVSRKVGNAVERNRVKRCLRVAWWEAREILPRPADVHVLARPGGAPRSAAAARESLTHLLRRHARQGPPAPAADASGP